jgi:hypothetical protein
MHLTSAVGMSPGFWCPLGFWPWDTSPLAAPSLASHCWILSQLGHPSPASPVSPVWPQSSSSPPRWLLLAFSIPTNQPTPVEGRRLPHAQAYLSPPTRPREPQGRSIAVRHLLLSPPLSYLPRWSTCSCFSDSHVRKRSLTLISLWSVASLYLDPIFSLLSYRLHLSADHFLPLYFLSLSIHLVKKPFLGNTTPHALSCCLRALPETVFLALCDGNLSAPP